MELGLLTPPVGGLGEIVGIGFTAPDARCEIIGTCSELLYVISYGIFRLYPQGR